MRERIYSKQPDNESELLTAIGEKVLEFCNRFCKENCYLKITPFAIKTKITNTCDCFAQHCRDEAWTYFNLYKMLSK